MRLKIIFEETNTNDDIGYGREFFILRKRWFGWQKISITVGVNEEVTRFKSYRDAENYIFENFTNTYDKVIRDGNVYKITSWGGFDY